MGVCWLLVILLCCTSSSTCDEQHRYIHCKKESPENVFVPCPNMTAEDVIFKLFHNSKQIYELCTGKHKPFSNQTHPDVRPKNENGKLIGFNLNMTAITNQPLYVCAGTVTYPPPLKYKNSSVLVLEEGHIWPCKTEKDPEKPASRTVWIWIVVVVLLSTYSLAVTIAALAFWYKLKDGDSQNDYINTKPRAPPNRRKKRGLHHPIPKHF